MKNNTYNQKYWYSTEIQFCVICGREKKYRKRVYDKDKSTTTFIEFACDNHFI